MIKIATYNISHCQDFSVTTADDAPVCIEKYAQYIRELDADVIALNEVYMNGHCEDFKNQTEKLAQMAGYPYYTDAVGKDLGWVAIGNAILSKYPIKSVKKIPIPTPVGEERRENENEWYEDRVILCAVIDADGQKICVIATHFGLNGLEKERMLSALCPTIDGLDMPIVFLGDFNEKPHTQILAPIYERLKSCADEKGNTEYTFSSFDPYTTIDYIFVSKEMNVKEFNVRKDVLSDHRACLAVVEL